MKLIKEPKNIDLSVQSTPWTNKELEDFRKIMSIIKAKNTEPLKRVFKRNTSTKFSG